MSALQKTDLTPDQLKTLTGAGIIPPGTPSDQVSVFAEACRQHNLSPFLKEIYLTKYTLKSGAIIYATIVGIDGVRKKAQRTGQYAGLDDIKFNLDSSGAYMTAGQLKMAQKPPASATATVYRIVSGIKCAFTKTVIFDEFSSSNNNKWREMPWQMIMKVAEMFAIKSAFGDEMAGLNIEEEQFAYEGTTIRAEEVRPQLEAELDKAREHCKSIFEQCRYEEQQAKWMEVRINTSQDIAELRACYSTMREHIEELQSMDPATKRTAR